MLAYRPFLDPLPMDRYWLWLIGPLTLAIAVVYKAIKLENRHLSGLWLSALGLAGQILGFMVLAAGGLLLLTEVFKL